MAARPSHGRWADGDPFQPGLELSSESTLEVVDYRHQKRVTGWYLKLQSWLDVSGVLHRDLIMGKKKAADAALSLSLASGDGPAMEGFSF